MAGKSRQSKSSTGKRNPVADQSNWRRNMKAGRIKLDDDVKGKYLAELRRTGLKMASAEAVGVVWNTVKKHLENDPDFEAAFNQAIEQYAERVKREVSRRGIEGWEEPVYSGGKRVLDYAVDDRGQIITDDEGKPVLLPASVRKFSDRLLEAEAKRIDPAYRDKAQIDLGGGGGVLVVPPDTTFADFMKKAQDYNRRAKPPEGFDDEGE